jgi:exodeoxyribonuclease VII large subunit
VIRDILHRIAERFPRRVVVWPVLVQGEEAAGQVAAAVRGFDALPADGSGPAPRPDVLIVARGGGSLEDLWAFNEEAVVRAVAECRIPVISAVGHETDTTLIDLAADRRAPTPTAAAEMAVPVRAELLRQLVALGERQAVAAERGLVQRVQHVAGLARGLPDPDLLLGNAAQRLDDRAERLPRALVGTVERRRGALDKAEALLRTHTPGRLIDERTAALAARSDKLRYVFRADVTGRGAELRRVGERLNLDELGRRLPRHAADLDRLAARADRAAGRELRAVGDRLKALAARLGSVDYRSVLARGFALVRDERDRPVTGAEAARASARLELEFADGRIGVRPDDGNARPEDGRARPTGGTGARRGADSEPGALKQGRLL